MINLNDHIEAAYHEAGHAVIAWYYHRPILDMSITQDPNASGDFRIISLFGKSPSLPVHELERELDIIMAGVAAVERFSGKKTTGTGWGGSDYIQAVKIASKWAELTGKPINDGYIADMDIDVDGLSGGLFSGTFLDEFASHVRELMNRTHIWKCVEAIAEVLLIKNKIDGNEALNNISQTWDTMNGDSEESFFQLKNEDDTLRPWGEWRTE